MSDTKRKPRPRDTNQLAKLVVDIATGEIEDTGAPEPETAEPALGRIGGLKGGRARAEKLSSEWRKEIARQAAAGMLDSIILPKLGPQKVAGIGRREIETLHASMRDCP